jgi:plasmid stability protein
MKMSQFAVHNADDQIVRAFKKRALARGRSAEAKRRYFLQKSLRDEAAAQDGFAQHAAARRALLRSRLDRSFLIRRDRARDSHP